MPTPEPTLSGQLGDLHRVASRLVEVIVAAQGRAEALEAELTHRRAGGTTQGQSNRVA